MGWNPSLPGLVRLESSMFTGLVEGLGSVVALTPDPVSLTLQIAAPADLPDVETVQLGDSIALNGCCLTVVAIAGRTWSFQAGSETLSRTNIGQLRVGDVVNVERSLQVGARLGGHFVQGHVDALGSVAAIDPEGEWVHMTFRVPPALTRQMVEKGSITVDGVSLTLVSVTRDTFRIALIPHTLLVTTLGRRAVGDPVNIETDILGKYIEKLLPRSGE
jgi:riboflavin synthase